MLFAPILWAISELEHGVTTFPAAETSMAEQHRIVKIHCPGCGQKMDVSEVCAFSRIVCPVCGGEVIVPLVFAGITLEEPIATRPRVTVYRALDPTLDREVAVKVLAAGDPRAERFLAEARRAAAITHANVVPIYSCGVEQEQAYVVMQFLPGGDLARWLADAEEGGNPRFALKVGLALARALSAARRQELEHRHVVPRNVLLDVEGNIKLADFGLAASMDEGEVWLPEDFAYAAPEVLAAAETDWRADLFSVGTIVHHLLTGRLPGVGFSPDEIRESRLAGQMPPDPARLVGGLPPGLSDLVMSLQAFRPEDRPSGYEEVIGALRAFEQRVAQDAATKTRAVKPHNTRRAPAPKAKPTDIPASAPVAAVPAPPPSKTPGQLLVDIGLVAATIVLILLLAFYVWKRSGQQQPGNPPEAPPVPPTVAPAVAAAPAPAPVSPTVAEVVPEPVIPAEHRPRPAGLDFAGAALALDAYLASLPEPARAVEAERLALISGIRPQLVKDMEYLVYQDGIELADGRRLSGPLPLVNDRQLVVRTTTGSVPVRWTDLPFGQCARFLDYYLDQRVTQADGDLPADQLAEQRRNLGTICLRNAVLCEWYGEPERGRLAARLCAEYAKELLPRLRRLAPGTVAQG